MRLVFDDRIVVVGLVEGDQVADAGRVNVSTHEQSRPRQAGCLFRDSA
jgi:hypothetical protein